MSAWKTGLHRSRALDRRSWRRPGAKVIKWITATIIFAIRSTGQREGSLVKGSNHLTSLHLLWWAAMKWEAWVNKRARNEERSEGNALARRRLPFGWATRSGGARARAARPRSLIAMTTFWLLGWPGPRWSGLRRGLYFLLRQKPKGYFSFWSSNCDTVGRKKEKASAGSFL